MRSTFEKFLSSLEEIKNFIDSTTLINSFILNSTDKKLKKYNPTRQRFVNAAFCVLLYQSFETFIDEIIEDYAEILSKTKRYADLPNQLKKSHLNNSLEILKKSLSNYSRYNDIKQSDYAWNFYKCITDDKDYNLNLRAISIHDMNLRRSTIENLFSIFELSSIFINACNENYLKNWYLNYNKIPTIKNYKSYIDFCSKFLENIIDRRNQATHHARHFQELSNIEEMKLSLSFIENLGKSIFNIIVCHYIKNIYINSKKIFPLILRKNESPINNRTVVIINKPTSKLFLNQNIFTINKQNAVRYGNIKNLQIDDNNVKNVDPKSSIKNGIGILLNFKYPSGANTNLYALKENDTNLWPI